MRQVGKVKTFHLLQHVKEELPSKHVQFNEGLTDGTETLHLNLSSGSDLTSSHVTLITIRGLPNTLSLNKGSKLENGDWLLLEEDIPVESGDSDLKIIAQDLNFSGSFSSICMVCNI